jgi:hypothetical protein
MVIVRVTLPNLSSAVLLDYASVESDGRYMFALLLIAACLLAGLLMNVQLHSR